MNESPAPFEGVIYDMPDADYRKAPGVSNSMLKHIALMGNDPGSPAHYRQALTQQTEDSDAFFFGRMVHSRILTPICPLPGVRVIPDEYPAPTDCSAVKQKKCQPGDMLPWHSAARYCKDWLKDCEAQGIRPVTSEMMNCMNGVVDAVARHPVAEMALKTGKPEVSLFKQFWYNGRILLRKARLDWVPDGPALVDIKTCQDARKDAFADVFYKRRYFVQAAYYLDLWNEVNPDQPKTNFIFIAVEKFAPFAVSVFDVAPAALTVGRGEYHANLRMLLTCMELDSWPAYTEDVQTLALPQYALKKGGLEVYA